MVRNTTLKRFLKCTIFPLISFVNRLIPKDDSIVLLYCASMGIRHSLVPLRKYLLDNNFDKKYKIYCGIENMSYAENIPKVRFVAKLGSYLIFFRAGHVFYTAGQLPIKPSLSQTVIHMSHGNADFKTVGHSTNINNGDEFFFTYMIASSDFYVPIWAKAYACSEKNVVVAGDPLCDQLLTSYKDEYDFSKFSKVLVWLPTFRQSDILGYNDSHLDSLVPLFADNDYEELNKMLEKYKIRLIVKLHPVQLCHKGIRSHYDYLSLYTHKEFIENGYDLYKLITQSDALIGDYSSVSMQYLLMDRPMAFVVPDIKEYNEKRGFVFENIEEYMGGHIIKTKDDFWRFLDDFAAGKDIYKEKRHKITNIIYKFKDANSCKRIVELSNMTI